MNLEKLFEAQKVLRDRINYNGEDRFNKLVLALLVEIGECANEWRGFKFWSQNQKPNILATHSDPTAGMYREWNPLLEEYVDGLHFILELGIELNVTSIKIDSDYTKDNITDSFIELYSWVSQLVNDKKLFPDLVNDTYEMIFNLFIGIGRQLGFTWEEIEVAYFDKNQVNHARQESGY
ncbi:hypothetical protein FZC79_10390 [Rossellomorea vietnamensis]|uniref:dUTPase n=1 Tax=Rossellomorea vietnamensis TaxID=218284 RepID=A0A5D4KE27_9BACI|nr:dUTP diphosphatase [Rossellomorea vietnamensis]TYR75568.1 hypothetical protein FZC79_10390 [Rossellomorea vietnamensis]